jgi:hypothetical protein
VAVWLIAGGKAPRLEKRKACAVALCRSRVCVSACVKYILQATRAPAWNKVIYRIAVFVHCHAVTLWVNGEVWGSAAPKLGCCRRVLLVDKKENRPTHQHLRTETNIQLGIVASTVTYLMQNPQATNGMHPIMSSPDIPETNPPVVFRPVFR